jgi:hypothetical protein
MSFLNNALGAIGISHGNILKNALKMVGVPEGLAAGIGAVVDLKNGNFGSLLFKTGPEALKALTGGAVGSSHGCDRPSSILGTVAKVAGFCAVGGALGLGASALAGPALASTALGGLGGMMKGVLGIAAGLGLGAVGMGGGKMLFDMVGLGGFGGGQETKMFLGQTRTQGGTDSLLNRLPKPACFEDIVAAFMIDFVKDKQKEIEGKLDKLRKSAVEGEGKGAGQQAGGFFGGLLRSIPIVGGLFGKAQDTATSGGGNSESRNIEFEMLKNEMQKLSQMQQAMSNVLNEMHTLAMSAIRNIRG